MQRALHGLERVAARPRAIERARRRAASWPRSSTIPTRRASTLRALVRVASVDGRAAGDRRVLVAASGDVAGHLRLLAGGRVGGAPRLVRAARRLRRALAVAARGRRVPRHRARSAFAPPRAPLARVANRSAALVLARSEHLAPDRPGAARRLPARRHPRRPRRRSPSSSAPPASPTSRGLGRERRVRARAVRAAAPPARPARPRACGALAVLVCFGTMTRWEPSVLRAIAMAGRRAGRRLPRPPDRRAARARARGDRAAARRPVPPALGRLPALVRARAWASRCSPRPITRPPPRARGGCARRSASPPPRRSASRRCCSRCSARCRSSRCPANLRRGPARRAAHDVGARRRRASAAWPGRCRPRSRGLLELPTVGLLHALIAVADARVAGAGRDRRPRRVGSRRRSAPLAGRRGTGRA